MTPVEKLTNRFLTQYGAPQTIDPAAFMAEYERALNGTDPELLELAGNQLIDRRTFQNWPTVGECVSTVQAIGAARDADRARRRPYIPETRAPVTLEAKARVGVLVADLMRNLKEADRAGEGSSLNKFDWRKTGKAEFERMQRESPNQGLHRRGKP